MICRFGRVIDMEDNSSRIDNTHLSIVDSAVADKHLLRIGIVNNWMDMGHTVIH